MLKVPRYIIEKMYKVVELEQRKYKYMNDIENWLEKNNIDIEQLRDGRGDGLEELDYGNYDAVDSLIERIENEDIC